MNHTLAPPPAPQATPSVGAARGAAAAGSSPPAASQDVLAGVCAGIALRDLNLVDALLAELDRMEAREEDPDTLAELYRLDHLATRLRRNAENLRVLAGRENTDTASQTQHLVDVIRAAMSSIEQYRRVTIGRVASLGVAGFAADDLGRILAELLDNATAASPPASMVRVSAHLTEQGSVLVRIEDEGIGLPPERLAPLNSRLATAPVLDRKSVQHMGLAVVGRLAHRHRVRVRLDRRSPSGTIATVLVPTTLVCDVPEAGWTGEQTVRYPAVRLGRAGAASTPATSASTMDSSDAAAATRIAAPPKAAAETTANGLPRRRPNATPSWPPPGSAGTTANGLPRRIPGSIRDSVARRATDQDPADSGSATDDRPGPAAAKPGSPGSAETGQFAADLGAFAAGARAARAKQSGAQPPSAEAGSGEDIGPNPAEPADSGGRPMAAQGSEQHQAPRRATAAESTREPLPGRENPPDDESESAAEGQR